MLTVCWDCSLHTRFCLILTLTLTWLYRRTEAESQQLHILFSIACILCSLSLNNKLDLVTSFWWVAPAFFHQEPSHPPTEAFTTNDHHAKANGAGMSDKPGPYFVLSSVPAKPKGYIFLYLFYRQKWENYATWWKLHNQASDSWLSAPATGLSYPSIAVSSRVFWFSPWPLQVSSSLGLGIQ